MARTLPILAVTVALALAPAVAAVPSTDPALSGSTTSDALQSDAGNVTQGLHLRNPGASNVTAAESDTSSLLDVQSNSLHSRFEIYRLEERMSSVDSRAAQRELLRRELSNVSDRLETLRADEREARLAYVDGELTASEFVVTLATIGAKAADSEAKLMRIRERFGNTFPTVVRNRLRPLLPGFRALQGPVRTHAIAVLRNDARANPVYVAASANGTRLSMIQGRTWVSETTRWDNYDPAVDPVGDARAEIYPALAAAHPAINFTRNTASREYGVVGPNRELFETEVRFEYGRASGYFDGSSGQLFYEQQELFLDSLPGTPTEQRVAGDLVLTVNRTYAGGPLQVRLTNRTGRPLDGEVRIDGAVVGSTGFDGMLWVLDRGGTYNVTVVHGGERVRIRTPTAEFAD